MKIATFNLFNFLAPGTYHHERKASTTISNNDWQDKKQWVAEQLQKMDADVVGFQEVYASNELKAITEASGYHYYETVEQPVLENDVYPRSINAIASRLPILSLEKVTFNDTVREELHLQGDTTFSRPPIKATIDSQSPLGKVVVYVAHLKSKRPVYDDDKVYEEDSPWEYRVHDTMKSVSRGSVIALIRRSAEATMLYQDIAVELEKDVLSPVVVLGDLNTDMNSIAFQALTMQMGVHSINDQYIRYKNEYRFIRKMMYDRRLHDAFGIASHTKQSIRPYTYVYEGEASVLDYILVSNTFSPLNAQGIGKVNSFQVLNDHVVKESQEGRLEANRDKGKSDHGQVVIELLPRNESPAEPIDPVIPSPTHSITRQEFIEMAGGVYQNHKGWGQWKSYDKKEHFWNFFFNPDYGWVKSVYGAIPFDELYQKKRHSIEHIIPRSFTKAYLRRENTPNNIVNGATTNPFNFAVSERNINSSRSSFPFDMDDDKVVRPFRIHLNPDAYGTFGLDDDREWVIPSRSRGDIARAILYMVLIYDINELYNEHLGILVHWAKVDLPTSWEIAFNEWVHARLGIRNPFVADAETSLSLLNDKQLLQSVLLNN